jgi:hypothetical protein
MVPVYVYVETTPNRCGVDKIVVDDEALDLSKAELADPDNWKSDRRRKAAFRAAKRSADDACDWPAWEFGW